MFELLISSHASQILRYRSNLDYRRPYPLQQQSVGIGCLVINGQRLLVVRLSTDKGQSTDITGNTHDGPAGTDAEWTPQLIYLHLAGTGTTSQVLIIRDGYLLT
jgi:hypothetical protein